MDWNSLAAIAAVAQAVVVAAAGVVALVQIRHLAAQNCRAGSMIPHIAGRSRAAAGTVTHPEYFVINTFNQWGYFASDRIVDEKLLIQTGGPLALVVWAATLPVIALRRTTVPESGRGFESLVVLARDDAGAKHFDHLRNPSLSRGGVDDEGALQALDRGGRLENRRPVGRSDRRPVDR